MNRQPILTARKPLVRDSLDWQVDAACRGEDLALFFGVEGERQPAREIREAKAKETCHGCPVRTECLDYAISRPEKYGTWGGLNEDERASERRKRMRRDQKTRKAPKKKTTPAPKPKPKKLVRVNAVGARRRIRAATVAGRILTTYSRLSGVSETTLSKVRIGSTTRIDQETARRIADAYPQILAMDNQVHPMSLQMAAEHGWPGPEAWEGIDIDDPNAHPHAEGRAA